VKRVPKISNLFLGIRRMESRLTIPFLSTSTCLERKGNYAHSSRLPPFSLQKDEARGRGRQSSFPVPLILAIKFLLISWHKKDVKVAVYLTPNEEI